MYCAPLALDEVVSPNLYAARISFNSPVVRCCSMSVVRCYFPLISIPVMPRIWLWPLKILRRTSRLLELLSVLVSEAAVHLRSDANTSDGEKLILLFRSFRS